MACEGRTMAEAVRKWQHDALPRISALSHAIGTPMDPATRSGAVYATKSGLDSVGHGGDG